MILWIFLVVVANITNVAPFHPEIDKRTLQLNDEICRKIGEHPFFTPEMVLGKPWRIYYLWHMRIAKHTCVDITFKKVTTWTVDRYREDMSEYLASQPDWDSALMFVRVGSMNRQLLLFPDGGPPGRVVGAPNIRRDRRIAQQRKGVEFMPFQFKLLRGGKYLVMVECRMGVVSLSARVGEPPFQPEIAAAAAELGIGEGRPACVKLE